MSDPFTCAASIKEGAHYLPKKANMYARVISSNLVVGKTDDAISVWRDKVAPNIKQAKGFKGAYLVGDRSMMKVGFFRPPQHKEMGKNGDHTRGMVLMEATIEATHPSAWGMVTGVTGASALVGGP